MVAAWNAFSAADAWGEYDGSDHAKALYAVGWPEDVRPYQAPPQGGRGVPRSRRSARLHRLALMLRAGVRAS
jgi:hypothetical protein